jgi:Kdo2-lipid IVA lauroyltransferase/acyltransferase
MEFLSFKYLRPQLMKAKRICQWLLYRTVEIAFYCLLFLLRTLPLRVFQTIASRLVRVLIYFVVPRRRIVKNLDAAFGERYSPATKKGMAKGVQEHYAKHLIDCLLQFKSPDNVRQAVTIVGLENLKAALAKGKGVIALGAHIGNFVLVGARLGAEGFPFSTLFRLPQEARLKEIIYRYLPYFHQRIIPSRPKRSAVKNILGALKNNEVVFILGDNLKKGKVETLLFGQPVPSPRGPVSLAMRSGAALVPLYLVRNYQGGLQLVIEPEFLLHRNGNLAGDITRSTQLIVGHLERLIRRFPDQWNWLTVRMRRRQGYMYSMGGDSNSAATSFTPGTPLASPTIVSSKSD